VGTRDPEFDAAPIRGSFDAVSTPTGTTIVALAHTSSGGSGGRAVYRRHRL